MLLLHCATLALLAPLAVSQGITDSIDWEAYLSRHDPIWAWNNTAENCTHGYTVAANTFSYSPGASCGTPVPCASAQACVEASALLCDACAECDAFALDPGWRNGTTPQLFQRGFVAVSNAGWTLYSKGGPSLPNHTSCSTGTTAAVKWEDSAFLGNGLLGSLVMMDGEAATRTLRLQVGRVDVADHREAGRPGYTGSLMFDKPRLPVGSLGLTLRGNITSGALRIHLHNATLTGSLISTLGAVAFTMVAHRTELGLLLAWSASGGEAVDAATGTGGAELAFTALPGNSTRSGNPAYLPNPPPACTGSQWGGSLQVCSQPLLAGSGSGSYSYATALATRPVAGASPPLLLTALHIANDWPVDSSAATAAATVQGLLGAGAEGGVGGLAALLAAHASAWQAWWPASFVSVQDTLLEAMYVMQQYKYGSAARGGGVGMDLMGPWWQRSGWELYWPDMNVPTQYAALATARRWDILGTWTWWVADTLRTGTLSRNVVWPNGSSVLESIGFGSIFSFDMLSPQVLAPGVQLGNPAWLALPLYQHAAFTGNASLMKQVVFPYLRGCMNAYLAFAVLNASDGLLHLPPTASPEYPYPPTPAPAGKPGWDTHYDLALFQWGLRTLLAIAPACGQGSDPLLPVWQAALARLAPLPVNEHGYMVDAVHGFDIPHRHFSHLFAIYPLHLTTWEGGSSAQALMQLSLDRWTGLTCGGGGSWACPNGFTYDGTASISALLPPRAAAAAGNLTGFITSGLMHASTLYSEGRQPCMESPVAAAASLQEMLLQSWGGKVRVFPAAPWQQAVFHQLGAEGGFAVSAALAGSGSSGVAWVGVEAPAYTAEDSAPRPCVLLAPGLGPAASVATVPAGLPVQDAPGGGLAFTVLVGQTVLLYPKGGPQPSFVVAALPGNASQFNYWGKH